MLIIIIKKISRLSVKVKTSGKAFFFLIVIYTYLYRWCIFFVLFDHHLKINGMLKIYMTMSIIYKLTQLIIDNLSKIVEKKNMKHVYN